MCKSFSYLNRQDLDLKESLIILPLGATEQHGPHLPLGTDNFIVEGVIKATIKRVTDVPIVVAPTIAFGQSEHHMSFGATISLTSVSFSKMLYDACRSIVRTTSNKLLLVNGHAGNNDLVASVVRSVAFDEEAPIAGGSYWNLASAELAQLGDELPRRVPGHAGAFETSMMLALQPGTVSQIPSNSEDEDLLSIDGLTIGSSAKRIGKKGFTDDPTFASAENGIAFLDAISKGVERVIRELWVNY